MIAQAAAVMRRLALSLPARGLAAAVFALAAAILAVMDDQEVAPDIAAVEAVRTETIVLRQPAPTYALTEQQEASDALCSISLSFAVIARAEVAVHFFERGSKIP